MKRPLRSATLLVALSLAGATCAFGDDPTVRSGDDRSDQKGSRSRPNVLMIVTDDQRYEGTMAVLPSVRKWLGDGGTEFSHAYSTTPLCCPARASILTGRYTHNHGVYQNFKEYVTKLRFDHTLPAYLGKAGYRTALIGKYFNHWPERRPPPFFDDWTLSLGAKYYEARFNSNGRHIVAPNYVTDFVADRAAAYVRDSADRDAPWFLYVATNAVHAPYQPKDEYADADIPEREPGESVGEVDLSDKPPWIQDHPVVPDEVTQDNYEDQLRSLLSVDDMVDKIMRALEDSGEDEETMVIFTSDQGFLWREHGLRNKRYPYLPSIQIPLFLRWPAAVEQGVVDDRLAANVDIAPTVLEAAGIEAEHPLEGISLLQPNDRQALLLEYINPKKKVKGLPSWAAILTKDAHYIEYYASSPNQVTFREYYDLDDDPSQMLNLLGDPDPGNDPGSDALRGLQEMLGDASDCVGQECRF